MPVCTAQHMFSAGSAGGPFIQQNRSDELVDHRESGRQVRQQGLAGAGQMFAVKQHEGASHQHSVKNATCACDLLSNVFLQGCTFAFVEHFSTHSAQGISTARNSSLPCLFLIYLKLLKMCLGIIKHL